MYCDPSLSPLTPRTTSREIPHKAPRSVAFVSVQLYHTGEQFTKKPPEIATDHTKKFRKQSILLPNSTEQLTNECSLISTWTKRISETTTKTTQNPTQTKNPPNSPDQLIQVSKSREFSDLTGLTASSISNEMCVVTCSCKLVPKALTTAVEDDGSSHRHDNFDMKYVIFPLIFFF